MRKGFRFASFLLALCMLCALLGGCMGANVTAPQPAEATPQATSEPSAAPEQTLDEDGELHEQGRRRALYSQLRAPSAELRDEGRGARRGLERRIS